MSDSASLQWRQLAAGPFQLHVYHATEQSFGVTATIVEAEREVLLIDAQFRTCLGIGQRKRKRASK